MLQRPKFSAAEIAKRRQYGENNINTGRLREFPWICVDKFFGDDLQANIFILTHCHTDHMVGLDEDEFWERLHQNGITLYTSEITPLLMQLFERYLRGRMGIQSLIAEKKLVSLPVCCPTELHEVITGTNVMLTFLPAGHCPGSVMLQLEYDKECIIYTGDCRIGVSDLKKLKSLHSSISTLKTITHLYIDTTFCSSRSQDFPGRIDALDELVDVVKRWIGKNRYNCVNLSFSARFAHEFVLLRLHKEFNIQAHVSLERYEIYREIPQLIGSVTLSPNTKFHLCERGSACLLNCIEPGTNGKILTIRLSSLWYMANEYGSAPRYAIKYDRNIRTVTVCYAMHSSLEEIGKMIEYLKPNVVTPLVKPSKMLRSQLELELRQAVRGMYIFEDYPNGMRSPTSIPVKTKKFQSVVPKPNVEGVQEVVATSSTKRKRKVSWNYPWTPSPPPVDESESP